MGLCFTAAAQYPTEKLVVLHTKHPMYVTGILKWEHS